MLLFKKASDLGRFIAEIKNEGRSIGFVPTMGALHEGHLSLVQKSLEMADWTVCSIFVNPTQFNDPADLEKYPRTPDADLGMLVNSGCQTLFMPGVEEVYPPGLAEGPSFDFGSLDKRMEGARRPGHFAGVAQVVRRLLELVQPRFLFMGQKDFQQAAIVRSMLQQMYPGVNLVLCPIIREADGLAMSSRNVRLTQAQRNLAPLIYQTLLDAKKKIHSHTPAQLCTDAMRRLAVPGMVPEYFEIVDGHSLLPVQSFEDSDYVVACTAVKLGEVRLIDNSILKN